MRYLLIWIFLSTTLQTNGQINNDTIRVVAVSIDQPIGSKVKIQRFTVLFSLTGKVYLDTILVGFHEPKNKLGSNDTVVLTLLKYSSDPALNGYYIFPDYDLDKGSSPAKIETVNTEAWEACETGKDSICTFTFNRPKSTVHWFLRMPCGGTYTTVTFKSIHDRELIKTIEVQAMDCPPYFELTPMYDGIYQAYMIACGLGGKIKFELKSNP